MTTVDMDAGKRCAFHTLVLALLLLFGAAHVSCQQGTVYPYSAVDCGGYPCIPTQCPQSEAAICEPDNIAIDFSAQVCHSPKLKVYLSQLFTHCI